MPSVDSRSSLLINQEILYLSDQKSIKDTKCGLRHVTTREIAFCIDDLHVRSSDRPWHHFAFIGDSRIRQQFYNLLKVDLIASFKTRSRLIINSAVFLFVGDS